MAEYSNNYTQNTISYTFGTEVYKFSRTVDVINPSAIDNSCIYCGAENGSMYDYYPTYMLGTAEKAIMNNHWAASGGTFTFQNSATATPYNITFVKCGETGTATDRGFNTVYQIGKTIYNKASSASNSSMRVLNPTDIRKLIFSPRFYGYTASPSSTYTDVDLKYIMDHPDDFFVQDISMNVYAWNGSTFTNDTEIQSIRPCIVGENYFIPVINVLGRHIFGMTDYNSRRDYTQSFYGTYDKDNMPMSFAPILTDETLTYDPNGSSGGGATQNNNKWKWSYNSYNSSYEIVAPARQVLQLMAFCGCYFIDSSYSTSGKNLTNFWNDDHIYLGEMKAGARTTGNFIKGTDLLTSDTINKGQYSSQTDFDPSPAPSGDDEDNTDPVSTTGAPFGTGLAHYYISTVDGAALNQISEAMSTWDIDTTKKDLYRNLISCKIVKPPTAVPATPGVFVIYGEKPQYQGADITINEVTGNPDISFGPYTIDRKFNDFRDRAPYSRAEIFLPYCGWCALPSHVIGRSVSVAYYSDIIAGTVKAVVFCGTNPVAEASGVMSVDIPFAAQNVGEKVAAANIGMLAYGRAAIQTAAGIGTAVASKGKSGWGNILSGGTAVMSAYNQLAQVENGNYTEICGKSGDGCALAGVDTIVIKITRPLYGGNITAPYVPAGFAHTVGFVSMKQSKVNACNGLIVCDNVEVSGISGATDAERAEIKRVLESGLYVNSPPE